MVHHRLSQLSLPRPHLALVEWFKINPQADPDINMFMASNEWRGENRACDIVPLEDVVQPYPSVLRNECGGIGGSNGTGD